MDQESWKAADERADEIAEKLDQLFDSPTMEEIKRLVGQLSVELKGGPTVSLNCSIDLFDPDNEHRLERELRILTTGISTTGSGEVYRTHGDSSPQRYVVDGEISVVPHDHCPKCWGDWGFKWQHRSCPTCDAVLGENCRILLDSDVCPHCEEGKVSAQQLRCDKCGFEVDPACVTWG